MTLTCTMLILFVTVLFIIALLGSFIMASTEKKRTPRQNMYKNRRGEP